jgi:hypothetical protein
MQLVSQITSYFVAHPFIIIKYHDLIIQNPNNSLPDFVKSEKLEHFQLSDTDKRVFFSGRQMSTNWNKFKRGRDANHKKIVDFA